MDFSLCQQKRYIVYKIIGATKRVKKADVVIFGIHSLTKSLCISGEAGWLVVSGKGFLKGREGWSLERFGDGSVGTVQDVVPLNSGVLLEIETP